MSGYSIVINGLPQAYAKLASMTQDTTHRLAAALYAEANAIFNASQDEVPVDTGTLKSSGFVSMPATTKTGVEVVIGYGGAAGEYAVAVHENLDAFHEPPTKAKYLEDPAVQAQEGMAERIIQAVWGNL